MTERGQVTPADSHENTPDAEARIRAHETRPGRLVFTEDGNTEAWIATDLVVDPEA